MCFNCMHAVVFTQTVHIFRSGPNKTQKPRRGLFLTYNPSYEGELRELYYRTMYTMRNDYLEYIQSTDTI